MRILITTHPFASCGDEPSRLLAATGWEIIHNPFGRRLRADEIDGILQEVDGVIAGTEPYPTDILARHAGRLQHIARVGIGLDNLDVAACHRLGIGVSYTPEAPSQAVAELTVAQILNLLRFVCQSDRSVRDGTWNRHIGRLITETTIGIVGCGRIGSRVARLLQPFSPKLLICEITPDRRLIADLHAELVGKQRLFSTSDLVTLHIPGDLPNHNFVDAATLELMPPGAMLINTSRGSVVDLPALERSMADNHLGGVSLDVFPDEPYRGPLVDDPRVILTAHIGASARASRFLMELTATQNLIAALTGAPVPFPAPR